MQVRRPKSDNCAVLEGRRGSSIPYQPPQACALMQVFPCSVVCTCTEQLPEGKVGATPFRMLSWHSLRSKQLPGGGGSSLNPVHAARLPSFIVSEKGVGGKRGRQLNEKRLCDLRRKVANRSVTAHSELSAEYHDRERNGGRCISRHFVRRILRDSEGFIASIFTLSCGTAAKVRHSQNCPGGIQACSFCVSLPSLWNDEVSDGPLYIVF